MLSHLNPRIPTLVRTQVCALCPGGYAPVPALLSPPLPHHDQLTALLLETGYSTDSEGAAAAAKSVVSKYDSGCEGLSIRGLARMLEDGDAWRTLLQPLGELSNRVEQGLELGLADAAVAVGCGTVVHTALGL